ncbi:MAG: SUMF1/EgtB/PvdO family nonheme iron enzyme [Phycisphaerae bacterium]|jgi:hypothetical protein
MRARKLSLVAVAALLLASTLAMAGTIHAPWPSDWNNVSDPNMWCMVGDVGNVAYTGDPNVPGGSVGSVAYEYKIGKFEVTAGAYTAFLNAVAATDTYGLYNTAMGTDGNKCNITRSGSDGSYTYTAGSANKPVNFVGWRDAVRYVNWLTNGQLTGAQDANTTETGSYNLVGLTDEAGWMAVTRIAEGDRVAGKSYFFIPNENEFVKAAHYDKNKSGGAGYYMYETLSDSVPGVTQDGGGTNVANFKLSTTVPITVVGEFESAVGPYGTFDMGGNVREWTEGINIFNGPPPSRALRGGGFSEGETSLRITKRDGKPTTWEESKSGFRIVEIPEPATMSLLVLGGLAMLRRRK